MNDHIKELHLPVYKTYESPPSLSLWSDTDTKIPSKGGNGDAKSKEIRKYQGRDCRVGTYEGEQGVTIIKSKDDRKRNGQKIQNSHWWKNTID